MDATVITLGYFWKRRIRNILITVLVLTLIAKYVTGQRYQLERDSFTTGYFLLAAVLFLTLYNLRKKLPMVPLGTTSTWMQAHIYVGFGTIFVFLLHVGFRVPTGILESVLAGLFLLVSMSGVYGLYLTRTTPRKLAQLSAEVIYERIPAERYQLAIQASQLALESVAETRATAFADFHTDKLIRFFEQPRSMLFMLLPSSQGRRRLMKELSHVQQFCSETERHISQQMFSLIRKKDDLDYQFALQHKLKIWLFTHVGLSYSLLAIGLLHTVLAHAFQGGF